MSQDVPGAGGKPAPAPRIVTFDLMPQDPDFYFVLTEALGEWAARTRAEVEDNSAPESHLRWAETAELAVAHIETALSADPATLPARDEHGHLRLTCGACGEEFGTNCDDDDIRCAVCSAHRCPHCGGYFGED